MKKADSIQDALLELLQNNRQVRRMLKRQKPYAYSSLIEEALVTAAFYRSQSRPVLIVKKNLYGAQRLYERLSVLLSQAECALFAVDESLRVEAIASSPELRANQVETLSALLQNPHQVIVTNPAGLLRFLPEPELFRSSCLQIRTGMRLDMEEFKRRLRQGGYAETVHIDQPLSFAARGGIVDVYSINYDQPLRIEFFDDEVDSIRFFDVATQATIVSTDHAEIVPASDILFSDEDILVIEEKVRAALAEADDPELQEHVEQELADLEQHIASPALYRYLSYLEQPSSLLDYLPEPVVILSDPAAVDQTFRHTIEETTAYIQELVQEHQALPRFTMWHDLNRLLQNQDVLEEDPFADNISGIEELDLPNVSLQQKLRLLGNDRPVLLLLKENEVERVLNACVEGSIPYTLLSEPVIPEEPGLYICIAAAVQGFSLREPKLICATSAELFAVHYHAGRFEKKFRNAEMIQGYEELQPGDYVVHSQYGVGQYVGLETREVLGSTRDFLKIVYRGNAELLVPLEQFRLVRKFVSREGVVPRLNKLGSGGWEKTRKKLESDVTDLAERLLDLYASRTEDIGYAYQPDTDLQRQFESEFEYELTPDQEKAVEDVKKDMESPKPMDRLICGDVGFGKTEIAIRAAFKAASENKQVAVLCPTTILAEQHLRTFRHRFENYPFEIRCLDRYVTKADTEQTLKDTREGKVDILIGTHRLLSRDVEFKDLGLMVVDEEQRFGVEHKEKIKEMKKGVDVLTLSATPIPRTLQMSLVGIRSLSQLETPPINRYTVQTYVVEKNLGLVTDAIERELSRGGQVFYVYNNIENIYNMARTLQHRLPDARIGIVHGKMDREEVEDVMFRFINKQVNVLVCTTIIENGIDIPNANTMLIDNAQNFGLAQIYQMKGRVGRSDRVAYAYLMVPPKKELNETAVKRLQAVKEFATLGSGYKIAMRDLTIRGAGDLLGSNQSGFIDTVGIDLYLEMLNEAIARKKGTYQEPRQLKRANVSQAGYIPRRFAPDDYDKISMYQKIDAIESVEELNAFEQQVRDQYGRLPKEVRSLFRKKELDLLINTDEVDRYREISGRCELTFTKDFSQRLDGVKLFELFSRLSRDIALRYTNQQIIATIPKSDTSLETVIQMIRKAQEALRAN